MRLKAMVCAILLFSLPALLSCQRGDELAGKYQAPNPSGKTPVVLTLGRDGKGSWAVGRETVAFSWDRKGSEIRLHSKAGGVIAGRLPRADTIEVTLPEAGSFLFERVRE